MRLSKEERDSLTRQLFEAVAVVGFLTWKRDYSADAKAALALYGADDVREQYLREFEKTAWAEIRELARNTSDDRLYDALDDWIDQGEAMALIERSHGRETGRVAVRPVTASLLESVMLDLYPTHPAVLTDFGISSQKHYEALYYPVRADEISPQQLDEALGSGAKLTGLVNAAPSNPHKGIEFKTAWDELLPPRPSPAPRPTRPRAKGRDLDMDR